jgi:hypothetical protein
MCVVYSIQDSMLSVLMDKTHRGLHGYSDFLFSVLHLNVVFSLHQVQTTNKQIRSLTIIIFMDHNIVILVAADSINWS